MCTRSEDIRTVYTGVVPSLLLKTLDLLPHRLKCAIALAKAARCNPVAGKRVAPPDDPPYTARMITIQTIFDRRKGGLCWLCGRAYRGRPHPNAWAFCDACAPKYGPALRDHGVNCLRCDSPAFSGPVCIACMKHMPRGTKKQEFLSAPISDLWRPYDGRR